MNNGNGIVPTIDLATNNNAYPYPVYPMMYGNSGFGGNGLFGGDGLWIILLLFLVWGNNGNNGGFFGNGFNNEYAWLSNGQKEIMTNTNNGFDTLHLSNQIEGVRDGVYGISNQLCNSTSSINSNISNGFFNSEIAACNRQMADMNQNFTNQLNLQNNLNQLNSRFSDCCCENRLGIANLNSTILSENCADRYEAAKNTRDIIDNANRNNQAILDKLCSLELNAKQDRINDLERQLTMANFKASQVEQTAQIRAGQVQEIDAVYNRLATCPVGTYNVCNPYNNGCGCNGNYNYGYFN